MRRTDRLFELIQLLRGGRLWRGIDLANELGVSLRTIYRDIETLSSTGIPVEGERGVGFMLRQPIFLPPMTLTQEELKALHFGIQFAARSGDQSLAKAANSLGKKINAVIPVQSQDSDYLNEMALYSPMPQFDQQFLPQIRDAIEKHQLLKLNYVSLKNEPTTRQVRPLKVELWGTVWTLCAWCELRDDFRSFRLDRLREVQSLGLTFADEPGRTYNDYVARIMEAKRQGTRSSSETSSMN